jgi:hypothetical protein
MTVQYYNTIVMHPPGPDRHVTKRPPAERTAADFTPQPPAETLVECEFAAAPMRSSHDLAAEVSKGSGLLAAGSPEARAASILRPGVPRRLRALSRSAPPAAPWAGPGPALRPGGHHP